MISNYKFIIIVKTTTVHSLFVILPKFKIKLFVAMSERFDHFDVVGGLRIVLHSFLVALVDYKIIK